MEVYLNVAETGIGTYGVNAGARRYFGHDASRLTPAEAARIAAIFPLPKRRAAIAPTGFTRRYGGMIAARMGVVAPRGPRRLRLPGQTGPARGRRAAARAKAVPPPAAGAPAPGRAAASPGAARRGI